MSSQLLAIKHGLKNEKILISFHLNAFYSGTSILKSFININTALFVFMWQTIDNYQLPVINSLHHFWDVAKVYVFNLVFNDFHIETPEDDQLLI